MNVIKVDGLSTSYGKKQVLKNVSFHVNEGEILGILGENGSGKSTLIKSICNILPHKGECFCEDKQLEKMSAKNIAKLLSYVPQKSGLELEMTVLDVVMMGFNPHLSLLANPSADMVKYAKEQLDRVGFAKMADADFMSLSEGQKQLCILVRALVTGSRVLLMDEPESALDICIRHRMMSLLRQWVREKKSGAVITLHDIELALNYCDRLMLIKNGENVGVITLKSDTIEDMEKALQCIYGKVSLRRIEDNSGKMHLVMLKEDI